MPVKDNPEYMREAQKKFREKMKGLGLNELRGLWVTGEEMIMLKKYLRDVREKQGRIGDHWNVKI